MKTSPTGVVLPRYYGVRLSMPKESHDLFVSPTPYAIAQLMLETPAEIRARVREWAFEEGVPEDEALDALVDGVVRREGTKNVLNHARRSSRRRSDLSLEGVKHYGGLFSARVKSKGRGGYHALSLPEPPAARRVNIGYPGLRSTSEDSVYNESKGKGLSVVGVHAAAFEIALSYDMRSNTAQSANMTGLYPRERVMRASTPSLPFSFNKFPSGHDEEDHALTSILMHYYADGASQYEASARAFENPLIVAPALEDAIQSGHDDARFVVVREREEARKGSSRARASANRMRDRIIDYLKNEYSYHQAGYCREFVGTPWEAVARRFEPARHGPVYSLVTSGEHPPLLVKKYLGEKASRWWDCDDPVETQELCEKIARPYEALDDVTRREARVELVLPDDRLETPKALRQEYDILRRG